MQIQYIQDDQVDAKLNQQLIDLLSQCFIKPEQSIIKTQRYFFEPPTHRWFIYSEDGKQVVAHVGLHDKEIDVEGEKIAIGGVAEVCVDPNYRGKGYVKALIKQAHNYMEKNYIPFSVLFGLDDVYGSSGYQRVKNLEVISDKEETKGQWVNIPAMVRKNGQQTWPDKVKLIGLTF